MGKMLLHLSGNKKNPSRETRKAPRGGAGGPTSPTPPTRQGGRLGDGLCKKPDTRHPRVFNGSTVVPRLNGSPGASAPAVKKKRRAGAACIWLRAPRRPPRRPEPCAGVGSAPAPESGPGPCGIDRGWVPLSNGVFRIAVAIVVVKKAKIRCPKVVNLRQLSSTRLST